MTRLSYECCRTSPKWLAGFEVCAQRYLTLGAIHLLDRIVDSGAAAGWADSGSAVRDWRRLATVAPELVVADVDTWTGLLVAVLGSSALGAIFGGYLTTRMRGRIEREEAWRSRLFEATDEFSRVLVTALRALGGLLPSASRGERRLREENGELTEETARTASSLSDLLDATELRLGHLELLVGQDSAVYQPAVSSSSTR
jgi:hypothetical protein